MKRQELVDLLREILSDGEPDTFEVPMTVGEIKSLYQALTEGPLEYQGGNTYALRPGERSLWVEIDPLDLYVWKSDQGVSVELQPHDGWDDTRLAHCYASFEEAQEELE